MLVFIMVVDYFKNNLKNILFIWNVTLSLLYEIRIKKYNKTTKQIKRFSK
jgi:hypothetical protein